MLNFFWPVIIAPGLNENTGNRSSFKGRKSKGNHITPDFTKVLAKRNMEPIFKVILMGAGVPGRLF